MPIYIEEKKQERNRIIINFCKMTKTEFLRNIPDIINHKSRGYGELEIVSDSKDSKGVCYRHENKLASCGNYAKTWEELYLKLSEYLKIKGYLINK